MDEFISFSGGVVYAVILVHAVSNLPTSNCRPSREFKNCSQTFDCGNMTGLSYPFYGLDRPAYCGHPGFELLDCDQYINPVSMKMATQNFSVLGINPPYSTVIVSRQDYFQRSGCPRTLDNITIDFSLFEYTPSNENFTLLYGDCDSVCSSSALKPMVYPCSLSATDIDVCFLSELMMLRNNISQLNCSNRLFLPVHRYVDDFKSVYEVSQGAWAGFELKWSANNEQCQECLKSGGQCGHDWHLHKFFCFCSDESECPFSGHKETSAGHTIKSNKTAWIAGVSIACSLVAAGMLVLLACYFRRKNPSDTEDVDCMVKFGDQDVEALFGSYGFPAPKRYRYGDLKKITSSFKHKLGEGGYGTVYKGKLHNGRLVAVKLLKRSKGNAQEFVNEVASGGRTNHVNIVTLRGFCFKGHKRALVYDFMPNGSLEKFVHRPENHQVLSWEKLFQIAVGIARGLEYLHRGCNTRILHLDIKPHNILLDEDFCPKISDFGLAKSCKQKESIISITGARGTVGYIAPEVFLKGFGGVSYKSDVYSYGMLVLEMVGCRKNANAEVECSSEQYFPEWIYEQLESQEEIEHQGVANDEGRDLQRKMIIVSLWCIQTNPSCRPAMSKVVEMLEGTLETLSIPPMPSLFSPAMSLINTATIATNSSSLQEPSPVVD